MALTYSWRTAKRGPPFPSQMAMMQTPDLTTAYVLEMLRGMDEAATLNRRAIGWTVVSVLLSAASSIVSTVNTP